MKDFQQFLKKQKVVGVAVGLTVGLAAVDMINRVLGDLVSPIIAALTGDADIKDSLTVTIGDATLRFGDAIDAVIQFLILAFVVYMIVKLIGADKWDAED